MSLLIKEKQDVENMELFKVKEVAQYLKVHPTTVYELIKEGRIPFVKVCSGYRFRKKDVDE